MSKEYDNTNRGVLFKNDKKGNEKAPDYKGQIDADGTEYWIAAWRKESKEGVPFLSISLESKEEAAKRAKKNKPQQNKKSDKAEEF